MSWSTSELRVRLAPLNRFKPSSKIFYWLFQGSTSFVDLWCFCSVLCLLCLCARLFICALWSPAGKGLTSWLSFVVSYCEFVTFPLISLVRCGTWLYRFLIFAPLLSLALKFLLLNSNVQLSLFTCKGIFMFSLIQVLTKSGAFVASHACKWSLNQALHIQSHLYEGR